MVAELCPDQLGESKRSPRPPSRNTGPTSKRRGGEKEGKYLFFWPQAQGSNVCIIIHCLFMPDHVVAFPEKLLKTIATRCTIFSLKFTKNRLAAGLHLDPLGELKHSPDPLAAIWGLLLREGEGRRGKGRGGSGKGGRERKGEEKGEEREREGRRMERRGGEPPHSTDPGYGPGNTILAFLNTYSVIKSLNK